MALIIIFSHVYGDMMTHKRNHFAISKSSTLRRRVVENTSRRPEFQLILIIREKWRAPKPRLLSKSFCWKILSRFCALISLQRSCLLTFWKAFNLSNKLSKDLMTTLINSWNIFRHSTSTYHSIAIFRQKVSHYNKKLSFSFSSAESIKYFAAFDKMEID